jgi:UDP-glucose 6-dehydrogenase
LRALVDQNFQVVDNWGNFIKDCDAVIVATRWPEYTNLKNHTSALQGKPILDCRRFLNAADFPQSTFFTVGKTTKQSNMLNFQ